MQTNFKVEDMSCNHCVRAITEAVQQVDAQARVSADLEHKTVAIQSDATADAIGAAIREAGYTPEPA